MTETLTNKITKRLEAAFSPSYLEVFNDSHLHAGHNEAGSAIDTHYRIVINAQCLNGKTRLAQHKLIYQALEDWINNPIHALAITVKN